MIGFYGAGADILLLTMYFHFSGNIPQKIILTVTFKYSQLSEFYAYFDVEMTKIASPVWKLLHFKVSEK